MFHGLFLRRLLVGGMCCLSVVGAAPRLDCLCPIAECQVACESGLVAPPQDKPCCCRHGADAPQSGGSAAKPAGCPCDLHLKQGHVTPVVQADAPPQPLVCWLDPASDSSVSGPQGWHECRTISSGLPPDDPVSRAQILRI
jgi:hypothetical protein